MKEEKESKEEYEKENKEEEWEAIAKLTKPVRQKRNIFMDF